jgi:phosphopantothenoylcysteine synthetase/decarboxylase
MPFNLLIGVTGSVATIKLVELITKITSACQNVLNIKLC